MGDVTYDVMGPSYLAAAIRNNFLKAIEMKNSWGKNELRDLYLTICVDEGALASSLWAEKMAAMKNAKGEENGG